MPEKAPPKKSRPSSSSGFSAEEKAAARERVRELRAQVNKADNEGEVVAKIAEMEGLDRRLAERLHAIVKANAPTLTAKTWYGMPAYAKDDEIVCWFQPAAKFKARYGMLGFSDNAKLDDGPMWPVAYALNDLTPLLEEKIAALVKKAVS